MKKLITCLVVCVMSGVVAAEIHHVPADFPTIQYAIDAALDGDEIIVAPGTYTSTANEVVNMLGKEIWLHSSEGPEVTIIDGEGARRGIICHNAKTRQTRIEGFTITKGFDAWWGGGSGLFMENSSPTITDCIITDNTASNGMGAGGVLVRAGAPIFVNCNISNNTGAGDGGGIFLDTETETTMTNCTISGNVCLGGNSKGAGIYIGQVWVHTVNISGCTISDNTSGGQGGGFYIFAGNCTVSDSVITNNYSGGLGGGVYAYDYAVLQIEDTAICSNSPNQTFGDWTDNGNNTVAEICPWFQGACCTGNDLSCVIASEENCDYFGHTWQGEGTTCEDNPCPTACLGDVTGDGQVDVTDILVVISVWGACP
jgi:parallel beta-helix repeat protein